MGKCILITDGKEHVSCPSEACSETSKRQSLVDVFRLGRKRRVKPRIVGRRYGCGDGFGEASSLVPSLVDLRKKGSSKALSVPNE